jgi:formamidopyrimidine-DNA glycosylase
MPELPEVETVKNYLKANINNDIFTSVEIYQPKLRVNIPDNLVELIKEQKIASITRRAKYIIINFVNNRYSLLIHLGMSGKLNIYDNNYNIVKHDHVLFNLSSKQKLVFNDTRRFGLITIINNSCNKKNIYLDHLGVEPLETKFTGKYLQKISLNSRLEVKKFIMEQKNIVGVGNIYAAEALFLSKIHPQKIVNRLTLNQFDLLVRNIKIILNQAIKKGGSTIKDFQSVDGNSGYFQNELSVYGREKQNCKICDTKITRIIQGGRSTFYCKKCQIS